LGVGLTTLPCKREKCSEASKKFSRILWRRPRPKLGCGAKEGRRMKKNGLCSVEYENDCVNDELEMVWKEVVVDYINAYVNILLDELRDTTKILS
jgi:hypothetical protein